MKRYAWIWIVKLLCAVLGIAAMTVMTRHVMRLEQESRAARLRAEHADKVRLALWRMETEANAVLLLENTRNTTDFLSISPEQQPDYARLYFQMEAGSLKTMTGASFDDNAILQGIMRNPSLSSDAVVSNCQSAHQVASSWMSNAIPSNASPVTWGSTQAMQEVEKGKRQEAVNRVYLQMKSGNIAQKETEPNRPEATLIAGNYRPLWLDGELFLVRQLLGSDRPLMQGVWLRTDVLKQRLLAVASDLFASANLVAITVPENGGVGNDAMALVSLPWKLEVTEVIDHSPILNSPAMTALRFAWVGLALAFVAGSVLVIGLVRLNERRAAFVSSVTHELRTPLTTFQLYTDLLANGMVREEAKRQGYFETLRREADRLGHLVENVLAFAQVERGSARGGVKSLAWNELWPSIIERMRTRLEQAGMKLEVVNEANESETMVRIDPTALEHILLNLADNAAKYAQPRERDEVVLTCQCDGRGWEVSLRDYGPGIAVGERRKIFRAFHKSAQAAAMSKPGVGLGLSLSKRLAKSMGAELLYRDPEGSGACFVLRKKS
jgi:signal transduction histidine kinase